MLTIEEIFPPFALRITCGPIELRVLRDNDFPELVELVRGGLQDPDLPAPFLSDWYTEFFREGQPPVPRSSIAWWWTQRATMSPTFWRLGVAVRRDGELVGMQDLTAENFPVRRRVTSGSWLGMAHRGRGTGTLMRQMAVGLAFDELGATGCESGYILGNHASAAVSRKTGYVENGRNATAQRVGGEARSVTEQRVLVTPETYLRPTEPVVVEGAAELREFLGIER